MVNCCALLCCRNLEGQAFIQENPSTNNRYTWRNIVTVHFSQLTNYVLTWYALIMACNGVHCVLKYQHCPMKQTLAVDQKGCQWRTVPYNSDKTNAQKSEIPTKKCLHLQEGPHTCLLWCWGNLYRLWGTNMQHTDINLINTSWAPSNSWKFI